MQQIPVYVFTGFLDSGKTKFIQETFEDERFNAGERTLLLVFEEGEEEYDLSTYPHKNVFIEILDQQTVTTKQLAALQKKYKAERIVLRAKGIIEGNDGTWIHFDMVPEEVNIRTGGAAITGKLCVIGSKLDEKGIAQLFGV